MDEQRDNYYKLYTGSLRNQAQDYTACLDTGIVDYDSCIEVLAQMIRGMGEHIEEEN